MIFGLLWTAWLLILSPTVLGLGLALRFWYVRGAQHAAAQPERDSGQ